MYLKIIEPRGLEKKIKRYERKDGTWVILDCVRDESSWEERIAFIIKKLKGERGRWDEI